MQQPTVYMCAFGRNVVVWSWRCRVTVEWRSKSNTRTTDSKSDTDLILSWSAARACGRCMQPVGWRWSVHGVRRAVVLRPRTGRLSAVHVRRLCRQRQQIRDERTVSSPVSD